MLENHRSSILIAAGTALFVSLGCVCLYVAFEKYIREPLQDEANMQHITPIAPPVHAEETPTFIWPEADDATNKDLNTRYAALETLKLDVAIAEQTERLNALRAEVEALSSQQALLLQDADEEFDMQQWAAPSPELERGIDPAYMAEEMTEPKLMGVYGIDGNLRACFSTAEGKRTVQQGQSLFGSRVTAVTLESVSFANGTTFYVGQ